MGRFRVIQWATGNVGRQAIEGVLAHPDLELAGCWVHSEAKHGRDVGEICGLAPIGVEASRDEDAVLALDADCVVYTPVLADTAQVLRILRAGKNVVTPLGWFFPANVSSAEAVEQACKDANVSLHGTGIHPGGITERFPLMVSSLSRNITAVRAEEFSDIRTYGAEFVVKEVMLFGKDPQQAATSPMLDLLGRGFNQSIDMVAHALSIGLDPKKRATHETAVATRPIATPFGDLEVGSVAGQRLTWEGLVRGEPVITARVNWLMGEKDLDPPWSFNGKERFEVEITGDPPVHLLFHGLHPESVAVGLKSNPGIVATAMNCVNAVPYVCEAGPGIKTYLDLPLLAGRAHASLCG